MDAVAAVALVEVFAFERIGHLVDLATRSGAESFFDQHLGELILVLVMIALLWPLLQLADELAFLQGIMGNMPMSIRWRGHRYLLRQSQSFFADDFAGRIATKLMQSALGVREVAAKLITITAIMVSAALSGIITPVASMAAPSTNTDSPEEPAASKEW